MKNKIILYSAFALLFAPAVSNARWGTDFTGQMWTMDGKELNTTMHSYQASGANITGKVSEDKFGGAARLFVEGNSRFRLGAAVGFGVMPAVIGESRETYSGGATYRGIENRTTYIPADLYLKYTSEGGKFSLFGGGGADYVMASSEYKLSYNGGGEAGTFTQKKIMPHVQAGCELFLAKWLSVNVGAKFLFSAILDNLTGSMTGSGVAPGKYRMTMKRWSNGEEPDFTLTTTPFAANERAYKYDYSGLRANIGLRMYFN